MLQRFKGVDAPGYKQWRTQDFRVGGVEVPQARGGLAWGGVSPSRGIPLPLGEGSGEGAVLPPQKIFRIFG